MKPGTTSHPKFRALMRSLSLPQYVVVGLLESVWTLAAQFADDGDLSRFDAHAIADYAGFDGNAEALLTALVECRWLDRCDNRLLIHDWDDHCPDYIYDREGNASNAPNFERAWDCPGMSTTIRENRPLSNLIQSNQVREDNGLRLRQSTR